MTLYLFNMESSSEKNEILARIANHLIMNTSFITDLGLYHGKMGIILFFVHYAKYSGETIYDDFAGELLDEVFEEFHTNLPINFESGLCGIGWAIGYLLKNNFIEGDSDVILEDVDRKIMERDILRIMDNSFEKGLAGISLYVETRLKSNRKSVKTLTFDEVYLNNIEKIDSQIKNTIPKDVLFEILNYSSSNNDLLKMELGLHKGCSGIGLKMILQ